MALPSLPRYVAAPTLVAPKFGLLSVIQWQENIDHVFMGVQFEPQSCEAAVITGALQCDDESPFGVPKDASAGVDLVLASPFAVYGSYECGAIGRPLSEAFERAGSHLELGKGRAIERAIQLGEAGNEPSLVGNANDITPAGGAVSLSAAIAQLEQYLRENYGGTGVIHLSPHLATLAYAQGWVWVDGDVMRTILGTPIAVGGGYDESVGPTESPAESPGADDAWIYATGAIYGWQSEVGFLPDTPAGAMDRSFNNITVLAEQTFVIAWECVTVAIQVDIDASDELLGEVSVANFPATQPVSGTVAVSNFPAQTGLTDTELRASAVPVTTPTTQLTPVHTLLTGGADRSIPANRRSYTVVVSTKAGAGSPTLDGVELPAVGTYTVSAPGEHVLAAATVATAAGDIVLVMELP